MSTILCLITWKVAIGRSNCTRSLAYSVAIAQGPLARADALRAQGDADVVDRPGEQRPLITRRTHPAGGPVVEDESGHLAGDVEARHQLAAGRGEREGGQAVGVARHDVGDVGGVAVEDHRLVAVEQPVVASTPGGARDVVERIARAALLDGDRGAPRPRPPERREHRRVAEAEGHERAGHRRGEPRPGQREGAGLLAQHDGVEQPEPGATGPLRDEEARPAEVDRLGPERVGHPALVVEHGAHVGRRRLGGEERARRRPERVLLGAEGEVHRRRA